MSRLALVFDLDDTLYPEADFVRSGFRAAGEVAHAEGVPGFAERAAALFESGLRGAIFDAVLAELAPDRAQSLLPRLIAAYRGHRPMIALHTDARELLAELKGRVPLGLISDGYAATQQAKVEALGLDRLMDRVVLTDALGGRAFWKPHPAAFVEMAAALGAGGLVYIADNPAKDFVAPNALGWTSVRIRRPLGEYRHAVAPEGGAARHEIASLAELPSLLGI